MVSFLIEFQSMTDIFYDCAFYNLSNTSIGFCVSGDWTQIFYSTFIPFNKKNTKVKKKKKKD